MVGKKFGRLTVIREKSLSEYPNGKRPCVQWYCDCDCGTKDHLVDGTSLRAGKIKSCGCQKIDSAKNGYIDIAGRRFGLLVAKNRVDQPEYINCKMGSWWLCECDCGNEIIVAYVHLKDGHTQSCGCLASKGEMQIKKILIKNEVSFIPQYFFEDCISPETKRRLKFDFAIFDRSHKLFCLIEFDGNQHYYGFRFSKDPKKNEERFRRLKLYDQVKNEYCEQNNIRLIRIPYWDINSIERILDTHLKEECYGVSSKES